MVHKITPTVQSFSSAHSNPPNCTDGAPEQTIPSEPACTLTYRGKTVTAWMLGWCLSHLRTWENHVQNILSDNPQQFFWKNRSSEGENLWVWKNQALKSGNDDMYFCFRCAEFWLSTVRRLRILSKRKCAAQTSDCYCCCIKKKLRHLHSEDNFKCLDLDKQVTSKCKSSAGSKVAPNNQSFGV